MQLPFAMPENWMAPAIVLIVIAAVVDYVATRVFQGALRRIVSRTRATWDDHIVKRKVVAPRRAHGPGLGRLLRGRPGIGGHAG